MSATRIHPGKGGSIQSLVTPRDEMLKREYRSGLRFGFSMGLLIGCLSALAILIAWVRK